MAALLNNRDNIKFTASGLDAWLQSIPTQRSSSSSHDNQESDRAPNQTIIRKRRRSEISNTTDSHVSSFGNAQAASNVFDSKRILSKSSCNPVTNPGINSRSFSDLEYKLGQSESSARPVFTLRSDPVDAKDPRYEQALRMRGICIADSRANKLPQHAEDIRRVVSAYKGAPATSETNVWNFLQWIWDSASKADIIGAVLPELVPLRQLRCDPRIQVCQAQPWHVPLEFKAGDMDAPPLKRPYADVTIGWRSTILPCGDLATGELGSCAYPISNMPNLAWPFFVVTATTHTGSLKAARLQNLYIGAIILSNLRKLRSLAGHNEEQTLEKIYTLSLELTPQSAHLSYYWASNDHDSRVRYYGASLNCWSLADPSGSRLIEAFRGVRCAVELIKNQIFRWIDSDLKVLEGRGKGKGKE